MTNALETPQGWRGHARFDRADSLEFGVATSAFQSEGGLNGAAEPATHWRAWEFSGRVERSGAGVGLWQRFDEAARRARAIGLTRFRLGIEWARLCPQGPSIDAGVVDGYAARLCTLREHGLEPIVTLHHFTHPAWLPMDFWLTREAPTLFADYAHGAVSAINRALVRRGSAPLSRMLTLNEPNMLALASCVAGVFPHEAPAVAEGSPLGFWRALRSLDAMLCAHTLTWRRLHALYAREAWPRPDLSTNLNFIDLYSLGKGLFDLLRAPSLGVEARRIGAFAREGRERFHRALFDAEANSVRARVAANLDAALSAAVRPAVFDRTLSTLYERWNDAPLDHLAVDLYDPFSAQQLRAEKLMALLSGSRSLSSLAGLDLSGVRLAEPWEWRAEPWALVRMLRALAWPAPSLPVDIDENGMAQRRDAGEVTMARADGVTRPMFLRGYLSALVHARVAEELPVRAYCHWTFVDNYELGRWAPRFGLYALDDSRSPDVPGAWSLRDAAGDDSAGAYARIIAALRGELSERSSALERALTPDTQ